jgi:hypothetical protein
MSLLKEINDYVDFARANHFIQAPLLLQLSLRMLQLLVEPSNVWQVLIRIVQKPELAVVCDEARTITLRKFQLFISRLFFQVLTTRTRECLSSLKENGFTKKTLIYFLTFNRMHINSETELLAAFAQFKK